jgi:hypothetical protein
MEMGWGSAPGYRLSWAVQAGGEHDTHILGDMAWSVAFAPNGDLFFGGRLYSDDVLFGQGTQSEISFDTWERGALYLARYTGDGVPIWVSSIQPDMCEVWKVLPLGDSSSIIAGRVCPTKYKPPVFGAGEPGEQSLDVSCKDCPFLAHYLADGAFEWVSIGGGGFGGPLDLARTPQGHYCIAGWFSKSLLFDDGSETGIALEGDDREGFAARFDRNGKVLWVRMLLAPEWTEYWSVAALPDESCAFLGFFKYGAELESGEEQMSSVGGAGTWSMVVAVYNAVGELDWGRDLGIAGRDSPAVGSWCSAISALEGDLVVTGDFNGDLLAGNEDHPDVAWAGPSPHDRGLFIARLRGSDGSRVWTSVALGTTNHQYPYDEVHAAVPLDDNSIVIGGSFTGAKTFGAGETRETTLVSEGPTADSFLASYSVKGPLLWAVRVVSSPQMSTLSDGFRLTDLSVNDDGSILASGNFSHTAAFGTGPEDAVTLESFGGYDAFVLRLDPDPIE